MAAATLISVGEYLRTAYHPDCDYVDGEVQERNPGEREHSNTQREIIIFLATHYPGIRRRILPEQRVQVKAARFRIPDVCVLSEDAPREQIITTPPSLCIEILSPEDTLTKVMIRIRDYFEMGVPVCWVIDPVSREAWPPQRRSGRHSARGRHRNAAYRSSRVAARFSRSNKGSARKNHAEDPVGSFIRTTG